ncbi:MAG: winged helix-turn-helix domain-containing protein, partial [Candidatus Accumulibacter sp.]|nr:winged helix-turn-helix domain-containing protein [Accumulibacter sp.]
MGRKASGAEWLEQAKVCLSKAKTIDEPRQAQAVVLPLEWGLSLEQTAQIIGVSVGWACQLRT